MYDPNAAQSTQNHTFFKPGAKVEKIKTALCVFVFGFVWTPDTQTMTSSPPPPGGQRYHPSNLFCLVCIIFVALNTAPWYILVFSSSSSSSSSSSLLVENQRHTVALNMYYRVSTARCVIQRYRDIPEMHQRTGRGTEGKRLFWPVIFFDEVIPVQMPNP